MIEPITVPALFQAIAWKALDRLIRSGVGACAAIEAALAHTRRSLARRWWSAVLTRPERFGPLVDVAADELDRLDLEGEGTPTPRRIAR